jgi:hypothetical protein
MRSVILSFLLFFCLAATGQNQSVLKDKQSLNSTVYIYDGLLIRSPEYRKKLDGPDIQKVDVITKNIKEYYNVSDSMSLILVTTKEKVNKRLKSFTTEISQIVKQYPYVEFSYKGEILDSDSLRIATLGKLKKNHYRVNFYPPFKAIKIFGEMGKNSVIDIFPK